MTTRRILGTAAALGLLTGLVEGAALLALQQADLLGWRIGRIAVWTEILSIAPLANLCLFVAVAGLLVLSGRALARFGLPVDVGLLSFAVCVFLMWFDWLMLLGRLRMYAVVPLALGLASVTLRAYRSRLADDSRLPRGVLGALASLTAIAWLGSYGWSWAREEILVARLPEARPEAPNVLIVVLDTVRADHLSAYGYHRMTSPTIDRLAAGGILFERAYSTSSWTLPAHASLLTGLVPHDHGATTTRLGPESPTLPELLSSRGYRTAAFSANAMWFTRGHGFGRGFVTFGDLFQTPGDMVGRTLYGRMFDEYIAPSVHLPPLLGRTTAVEINRAALSWLDSGTSSVPFLLVLNYFDAHGPYEPPQPFRRQFSAGPNPGGLLRSETLQQRPRLTREQLQSEIDAYDGGIAYLDDQLRQLGDELEERHLADDTITIVTSDHGESFGEHDLYTHRSALYLDLIHVPLVLQWPGRLPGGRRVDATVSIADLPSTVADLLDLPTPSSNWAPSLVPVLTDPLAPDARPYPVQELAQMPFDEFNWVPAYRGAMRSIVTPRWHYIEHDTMGAELYDVAADPTERVNLIDTPEGTVVARDLSFELRSQRRR